MFRVVPIDNRVFIPGLGYFSTTGPFGEPLTGQADPNNTVVRGTYSYVGGNQKLTETNFPLDVVQMGARVYISTIGRFLSVDPIEGGVDNNFFYGQEMVILVDFVTPR